MKYLCKVKKAQRLRKNIKKLISKINYQEALIKNMNELFYTYDQNANITFINDKSIEILGYTPEEMVGRNLMEFVPPEHAATVRSGIEDRLKRGMPGSYETPVLTKEGKRCIIKLNVAPIMENGIITGGIVLAEDITRRRQAEEDLLSSEEWFSRAFNASPSLMIIYDYNTLRIMDANDSFLTLTGHTRQEVEGKTSLELDFWVDLLERKEIIQILKENRSIRNMDILFKTKAGEARVGLYSADVVTIRGSQYMLTSINDITERKQLEREIARLDQLNMVGEMATGLGHEIRNPMTTVRGFLQLLGGKKECVKYGEFFDLMINELDRANSIISEFLSLSRNKAISLKLQNLNSVIMALSPLLEADAAIWDKHLELILNDIPDLALDDKEIRQLILNLFRNGLEAMPPGGTLKIETYAQENEVVLAVRDQGQEIPQPVLDKMGTPFFTTKEHGTGLGLAVCHSIAARHSAAIKIESDNSGTTFYIRFKAAD